MLDIKVLDIFNNIRDYDLEKAKQYLKLTISFMILKFDNIEEIGKKRFR